MTRHQDLTGAGAIHQFSYKQSSDPGAVGAKKGWIDTTTGPPYALKVRNDADTAWETVGSTGGSSGVAVEEDGSEEGTGIDRFDFTTGINLSVTGTQATVSGSDASETAKGIVELATDAETQAGTDTARAITPANLSARSATETRSGVIELATQAETDAGTDDARAVTPLKLATYSGLGGGGGSGNISGAYDIEAGSYTDVGMSDEFASGTLDAQWNTAISSGTIDFPGQPGSACYDLTSRSGTLLLQPAYSTSALQSMSLRQADGLTSGESLVVSFALPWMAKYASTTYTYFGVALNSSTTSPQTGTFNLMWCIVNHSGTNSNAPSLVMQNDSGTQIAKVIDYAVSQRIYLRISRKTIGGTDSFVWLFSTDGISWSPFWMNTATNFTQMWLIAEVNTQTSPSISPVFPVNWIRHVAATAHDLW